MISVLIGLIAHRLPAHAGLVGGEIIYRLFLSAYGLIFPIYILYRVIARRKNPSGGLSFMWIAMALALPLFWVGFIERQTIWLIPGMALVFLGVFVQLKKRS